MLDKRMGKIGGVAQLLVSRNSNPKTLGFDPLLGQGEKQSFCPSESTCADLFVSDHPSCVRHAPTFVRPYPSVITPEGRPGDF